MKNLIKYDSGHLEAHILCHGFMDGYTPYPESDEDQDGAEGNEEGKHHDNNGDGGEDGDPGHGNDQYQDGGEVIIKIIKMWEEMMMIKIIKMPEHMEQRPRTGCGTLIFKHCLSSRRVTAELSLVRNPSWCNWR